MLLTEENIKNETELGHKGASGTVGHLSSALPLLKLSVTLAILV